MNLFENLALTDDSHHIAQRKATAVAHKRVRDQFGAFLANADAADRNARLALVEDDIVALVNDVVAEHGGDADKITAAIKTSLGPMGPGMGAQPGMGQQPGLGQAAPGGLQTPGGGQSVCPQCGGQMVNGTCPTCQGGAYGGAAGSQAGAYGLTHSIPQAPSTGPVQASHEAAGGFCDNCHAWKSGPKAGCTCDGDSDDSSEDSDSKESSAHLARRPKMCPYHSEVVDISLGSGDTQAGYNAMSSHAWGDNHCKGGYEGACNFRPAMVGQKYWDDKQAEYAERREQRELERSQAPASDQELSIETEPIMHAEPLPVEPGEEGVSDLDGELANAPSAVGSGDNIGGDLAMAASTRKEAEALKTESLPTGDESGLGGPSPKIDKANSGDNFGWSLDPIDTQMAGSPNPGVEQDPTDKADYVKKDFLDQADAVTESETLPTGKGLDGGGFNTKRNITQSPTKTWSGQGDQHNPVTNEALSSVRRGASPDPDKNPIREIMEEYSGFLMPNQVESALKAYES